MSRKGKRKILFGLKVLTICGTVALMIKGIGNLHADAGGATEADETITADIATEPQPEEKEGVQETDVSEENQGIARSTDWDTDDAYLLAKIAMAEAESEDVQGKALVILVVLNRVRSDKFPNSISEVIFQESQFSPIGNGRFDRVEPDNECYEALELIRLNQWDESQGALYFESEGKSSWHGKNLQFLFQYGNHYFYTEKELAE